MDDSGAALAEARRVLTSPASPEELQRGVELMERASDSGCGEATELRALFEAMGIARPQSWGTAFDLLQRAAEQGSNSARRQLLLLAEPDADWESIEAADAPWADARTRISLDRLLSHGERTVLSENPRIRAIRGFATESECRWLVERARPRLSRATVIKKSGERGHAQGRSNSAAVLDVVEMDVALEVMRSRISAATRVPVPLFEPTQILHYSVGQEFRPHHDYLDPTNELHRKIMVAGQRIATFLIYLNEGFEGGETDFPAIGLRYRGRTGDAIFWANLDRQNRPDPLTMHAGLPPTSGEKWILSQWIRDRSGVATAAG